MTRRPWRFLAGLAAGVAGTLLLGEAFVRFHLPDELQPFLGDASSFTGVFRADPDLGADYRSLEDFRSEYAAWLRELEEPNRPPLGWAWFGNSFVQAPGMLADTAQLAFPETGMFHLGRNEPLPVRAAQVRLLLEAGLRPRRIVFVLLPIDTAALGKQPLRNIVVNRQGAITYRLHLPPAPFDALIRASRLATLAWVRSGRHVGNPAFNPKRVTEFVGSPLLDDLGSIARVLGAASRKHGIPMTVFLLPNREQIFGSAGFALQDCVAEICRRDGLDYLDARDAFAGEPDKLSLFLPDWHFTPKGNRILLELLVAHWKSEGAP